MATKFMQWIAGVLKGLFEITIKRINMFNRTNIGVYFYRPEIKIEKLVIEDKELNEKFAELLRSMQQADIELTEKPNSAMEELENG